MSIDLQKLKRVEANSADLYRLLWRVYSMWTNEEIKLPVLTGLEIANLIAKIEKGS